jgi:hypothetical protein
MKSVSLLLYKAEEGTLELRARDFNCVWTTAVDVLDDDTFLVAENSHNLYMVGARLWGGGGGMVLRVLVVVMRLVVEGAATSCTWWVPGWGAAAVWCWSCWQRRWQWAGTSIMRVVSVTLVAGVLCDTGSWCLV